MSTVEDGNKVSMAESRKLTWVERTLARLKGGDEAKVVAFHDKLVKTLNSQIDKSEKKIDAIELQLTEATDELLEKQGELYETLNETIEYVDMAKIQDSESRKEYVREYVSSVITADENVGKISEEIKSLETKAKEEIAELEKNIAIYIRILKSL